MSTSSKSAGSCKKCKRNCNNNTSPSSPSRSSNSFTFGVPILWDSDGNIETEVMAGYLAGYMDNRCLAAGVSQAAKKQAADTMKAILAERLDKLQKEGELKPPSQGKCQYAMLSNINIIIQVTVCKPIHGPPVMQTDVEIDFDVSIIEEDCPPE